MQTGQKIKQYCLNNDLVITSNYMKQWAKTKGFYFEFTTLYLPNENSIAEHGIRTNIEKFWSLITGYDLSKKLLSLGLSIAIYLKNQSPTKSIKESITPI